MTNRELIKATKKYKRLIEAAEDELEAMGIESDYLDYMVTKDVEEYVEEHNVHNNIEVEYLYAYITYQYITDFICMDFRF